MTALLARTAAVTAASAALLLGSLTMAGAAGAAPSTDSPSPATSPASDTAQLKAPQLTVPHGRKIG